MLSGHKIGTYLLYAIGEIFLVVLGILIAVSIDDWNEAEKIQKENRQDLLALKKELQSNQLIISQNLTLLSAQMLVVLNYMDTLSNKQYEFDNKQDILHLFNSRMGPVSVILDEPSTTAMNELVSSGGYGKLKSESIKKGISDIKARLEDLRVEISAMENFFNEVEVRYYIEHGSLFDMWKTRPHVSLSSVEEKIGNHIPEFGTEITYFMDESRFFNNRTYVGMMLYRFFNIEHIYNEYWKLNQTIEEQLKDIDSFMDDPN